MSSPVRAITKLRLQSARERLSSDILREKNELRMILNQVAIFYGLRVIDLVAVCRMEAPTKARHHYFYRAMMETTLSSVTIAASIARDHGCVLYGATKHAAIHNLPMPRGVSNSYKVRSARRSAEMSHG
jgi:chromosomal replication initiation ATPase DnaA